MDNLTFWVKLRINDYKALKVNDLNELIKISFENGESICPNDGKNIWFTYQDFSEKFLNKRDDNNSEVILEKINSQEKTKEVVRQKVIEIVKAVQKSKEKYVQNAISIPIEKTILIVNPIQEFKPPVQKIDKANNYGWIWILLSLVVLFCLKSCLS